MSAVESDLETLKVNIHSKKYRVLYLEFQLLCSLSFRGLIQSCISCAFMFKEWRSSFTVMPCYFCASSDYFLFWHICAISFGNNNLACFLRLLYFFLQWSIHLQHAWPEYQNKVHLIEENIMHTLPHGVNVWHINKVAVITFENQIIL